MANRVILDTGPLVALLNRQDQYHQWTLERFAEMEGELITSEAVLSETVYLVGTSKRAREALREMISRGLLQVKPAVSENPKSAFGLLLKYADLSSSLADVSLIQLYEAGHGDVIFTLDSDFEVYRDGKGKRLRVVGVGDRSA